MLLTAEQLQQIRQIILEHHNAYAVSQYGAQAVAPEILQALKDRGLADVDINTLQDAYVYGRIVAILGEPAAAKMTYPQFQNYVKKKPASFDLSRAARRKRRRPTGRRFVPGTRQQAR